MVARVCAWVYVICETGLSEPKIPMCETRGAFAGKLFNVTGVRLSFAKFGEPEGTS